MNMKIRKGTHLYWIKTHPKDVTLCPLCNSKLAGCHVGEYCSKENCPYVDGVAWLTKAQVKRYKNKVECTYGEAVKRAAENIKKEFDKSAACDKVEEVKGITSITDDVVMLKNKHIETTKQMNTYNNLTEAVVAAINELKSAGTLSAYQVTTLIREKTNQDEWQVVGCEARPNNNNIKYWINHDDVRRAINELYANNELDALGFTGRQFNGTYMEYSFGDASVQPADPNAPTVTVSVDPTQITSIPASDPNRVNFGGLGQRILNTVDNLKNIGGTITLKRIQSALKENGVTCQDIYGELVKSAYFTVTPGPSADDYYSQYVVE